MKALRTAATIIGATFLVCIALDIHTAVAATLAIGIGVPLTIAALRP